MTIPRSLSHALLILAGAGVLALAACSGETPDTHPNQPVSKRREIFKSFTRHFEPIGQVARERKPYKADEFLQEALALQKLADQPWALFPADSNYPPTRALPAVWDKPAEFAQASADYRQKVDALVSAAQGSDLERIKAAVSQVEGSCRSCHDAFRKK
ncbi:MAG: hypothetical protein QG612_2028 [Pseudomonadota bacterium]|nr:hypothetical protein [Pseudomonadota bacterium]